MSGICGWVGEADPAVLDAMLDAIDYRGDRIDKAVAPGVALGYRWWGGRPGKSPGIHRDGQHLVACAGTFAPPEESPAAALIEKLHPGESGQDNLDGAFAAAWWDGGKRRLTLLRDPFGVRSLYYVAHRGTFYFASEIKQLLAIPGLPREIDDAAMHKYLTFSLCPVKTRRCKACAVCCRDASLFGRTSAWKLRSISNCVRRLMRNLAIVVKPRA